MESVRIDKYLFSIRYYKSRTLAAEAIEGGRIKLNGETVKASKSVKVGDKLTLKKEGELHEIEVLGLLEKRVSAKDAANYFNLTIDPGLAPEAREMMKLVRKLAAQAPPRKGRPTKKDRRDIESWKNQDRD